LEIGGEALFVHWSLPLILCIYMYRQFGGKLCKIPDKCFQQLPIDSPETGFLGRFLVTQPKNS
ncbi:MAG: hypothetical protein WCD53_29325, partial [Microcoleus sp.]